jgi:hypothetical protein
MSRDRWLPSRNPFLIALAVLSLLSSASAEWREKVLYSFQGGATDGSSPAGGVVFDAAGNLYGATDQGGGECPPAQCGIVFQLSPPAKSGDPWTETVLHIFKGNASGDGNTPVGSVIIDSSGNLYGTTGYGGTGNCVLLGEKVGCGTVYELSPPTQKGGAWTETVLYSFPTAKQGYLPNGNLVFDKVGNLYGATMFGGGYGTTCNPYYQYCGAVFELSPPKQKGRKWTEKALHSFAGIESGKTSGDGASPNGGLVLDSDGAIYGTTSAGGLNCSHHSGLGCGTVFRLTSAINNGHASWSETVLHRFDPGQSDGGSPPAGVLLDSKGRLFGVTQTGGQVGFGTIFQLAPSSGHAGTWTETILYSFTGQQDIGSPQAGLTFNSRGDLYGTTLGGPYFSGIAFRLARPVRGSSWVFTNLYSLRGTPDGHYPAATLIFDASGDLYGTTQGGGTEGDGTIFEALP